MTEAKLTFSAEDRATSVINNVTKQLGIFSKEGLSMGVAFALINKGIQLVEQTIQGMIDYIQKGVEMNRQFELSLARLSVSTSHFDVAMDSLKSTLKNFSAIFATDLNTLTTGLQSFIREGNSAADSVKLLFKAEQLATVTGEGLDTTGHAMATAMDAFGYSANSAGYIANKFNQITSITGLSISQIDNLMGRSAITIQDNAITLDDFVNVLYTLYNEGVRNRGMLLQLDTVLKNFGTTTVTVAGNTTDLNTKFEKITSTTQLTTDRMKALSDIIQMAQTEKLDIGKFFDEKILNSAKDSLKDLEKQHITTLAEFDKAYPEQPNFMLANMSEIITHAGEKTWDLVRAILAQNDSIEQSKMDELSGAVERLVSHSDDLRTKLASVNTAITTNNTNIVDWQAELNKLTTLKGLNEDVRYMSMGLTDASYASKIHNEATRELVDSIRTQKDAIEQLNQANQEYSIESNKNSLAIMKIQYAAMGTRRGLTRSQEREIKNLERADMGLRISMTENQIAIDQKTMDLSPEEKRYNELTAWYNEEIYLTQNTYNTEIDALNAKIKAEQDALAANLLAVQTINAQLLQNDINTYNARAKLWGASQTTSLHGMVNPSTGYKISGRQFGGFIPETGPYLLHAGEHVIPANKTTNTANSTNNIVINISNPVIKNKSDTVELAHTIKRAISQGLLNSTGQSKSRWR